MPPRAIIPAVITANRQQHSGPSYDHQGHEEQRPSLSASSSFAQRQTPSYGTLPSPGSNHSKHVEVYEDDDDEEDTVPLIDGEVEE
jgi:hypothetical protein